VPALPLPWWAAPSDVVIDHRACRVSDTGRPGMGWSGDIAGAPIRLVPADEAYATFDACGEQMLVARSHFPAKSDLES
jgi:hypothetical protein